MLMNLTTYEIGKKTKKIWYFKHNTSPWNFPFNEGTFHNIITCFKDDELFSCFSNKSTEYSYPESSTVRDNRNIDCLASCITSCFE